MARGQASCFQLRHYRSVITQIVERQRSYGQTLGLAIMQREAGSPDLEGIIERCACQRVYGRFCRDESSPANVHSPNDHDSDDRNMKPRRRGNRFSARHGSYVAPFVRWLGKCPTHKAIRKLSEGELDVARRCRSASVFIPRSGRFSCHSREAVVSSPTTNLAAIDSRARPALPKR